MIIPPLRPATAVCALWLASFATAASLLSGATRPDTAPVEGLRDASPRVHALVGGRIVVAPGRVIEKGTLVVRDGLIEAVGADVAVPADARVWEVGGKTVYAGFIDADSTLFLPEAWKPSPVRLPPDGADSPAAAAAQARTEAATGTHAWNPRVTPERDAARGLVADAAGAEKHRALGFTLVSTAPARGVFRGAAALVTTGARGFNATVLPDTGPQRVAFEYGSFFSDRGYPTSLMGAIALVRQTLLDAQWYAQRGVAGRERPETNASLEVLGPVIRGEQAVLFEADDELDTLRAARIAEEFKLRAALRGCGTEYRVAGALAAAKLPVVLALDFPETPDVENPERAADVQLHELQQWELAPTNAVRLAAAGVAVALTPAKLKRPEAEFWSRVRRVAALGLGADGALAALTTTPANLLGVAATQGTLEKGKAANVVVAGGDLFKSEEAAIELVWVDGEPYELDGWQRFDARGTWALEWSGATGPAELSVQGPRARPRAKAGDKDAVFSQPDRDTVQLLLPAALFGAEKGTVSLSAQAKGDALEGTGTLADGRPLRWSAKRKAPPRNDSRGGAADTKFIASADRYPAGTYGRRGLPAQPEAVLFKNATVWTSGPEGVIEGGDVLVKAGVIAAVGKNLSAPAGAITVDATGKHISPGLIDCHSHTAVSRGVNEGAHSVTCEVRIGDVIDPTDIAIYRELAGGTTAANVLHGSANAMGGQNQVIKLRWGADAEGLKLAGAMPGVKFALGENVVRANLTTLRARYPLSRMGVPEIMRDTFNRAREYGRAWADFRAGRTAVAPRRDLRLEAALEMLNGERLIHIHSYRQDEVLAFVRLAEDLKLPVATFQHILEGYKVAPEIAKLGAGASMFSDWWAYKVEVQDGIPYNGVLMRDAGVTVSFNSDSNELARRLNTEAAKAVKYGGVPPAEALKFVTINPARQLHLDKRLGSLESGKDADLVVWSGSPLSSLSRPEQTWIDGRKYFDLGDDRIAREAAAAEKQALVQKALLDRQKALARGGDGPPGDSGPPAPQWFAHGEYRASYHDGSDVHNCSTCAGGVQ